MTDRTLILVLGDQLSWNMAALRCGDKDRDIVLMAEVADETTYVHHHKKKIAFVLSAMRHFASDLRSSGWQVVYVTLDDPDNTGSIAGELSRHAQALDCTRIRVTEPSEYRLKTDLLTKTARADLPFEMLEDDRFLSTPATFAAWAAGRKQLRMEFFYREMRRKTGLLMQGDEPEGGRWNFDSDNRKPASADLFMGLPHRVGPDETTSAVLELVRQRFAGHFGTLDPFWFAVTRRDALAALDHFVETALPDFGTYQDAMLRDQPFLYHSVLAQYLNAGLLGPMEICQRVERAYYDGHAPLNAVEGYIRQIIGWREYMRGIYWLKMPGYLQENALAANNKLPGFYWTGDTDMACMAAAIGQTRDEAYAHHIQRLMVTGNFAMLAGIDPYEVHEWYLAVYADAYEWVEAPNVLGMSQFADGGLVASKPYAASGNYIRKMSDYCGSCAYKVAQKTGPGACPFNPLYWDFLLRNRSRLQGNPRMAQMFRTWDRMAPESQAAYRETASELLGRLAKGDRI